MTDMLQKSENVAKNVANKNSQDLTEQWKKGELPEGYYYCKLILNNMKPSVERCKAHCIPMGVSADKGEEVLAPVPSYEEYLSLTYAKEEDEKIIAEYEYENAQLKELLKECKQWFDWYHIDTETGKEYIESWHKKGYEIHKHLDEALK